MADVKLKPCPFCGGEATLHTKSSMSFVECKLCRVETARIEISTKYSSDEKATEAWNRRAEPEGDD